MRIKAGFVFAAIISLALVLAIGVLAWGQQPTVTRNDGMFASYSSSSPIVDAMGVPIGYENKYVYVAVGMGTGGTQWRLNFNLRKTLYTPTYSWVQLNGSGSIPDGCVTLVNPKGKNLALLVDVAALPAPPFYISKTFSPPPAPDPAIDMDVGVIDLKWQWTNDLWNKREGHSVLDFGNYWEHSQGSTEENAALVWGSLFGVAIAPVETGYPPGRIGQTKTLVITHPK